MNLTEKKFNLSASKREKSMPFSEDDKALIKNLHLFEGYGSRGLLAEFLWKKLVERQAWYTAEETEEKWKHRLKA